MDDRIHLSGLIVSGCACYAWKFPLDHLFEVEQVVYPVLEVEVAWEYAVVLQVALEAEKFPVVCDCALILQLEEYQDSLFRDPRVQNRQYRVHLIRHLYHDRSPSGVL